MQIKIDWADNKEEDLLGYKVYRDGLAIAELGRVSEYVDNIPDTTKEVAYKVTAIDTSKNESLPSAIVTTVLNIKSNKFIIVEGKDSVRVSWGTKDYTKVSTPRTTSKGVSTITITGL